MLCCCFHLNDRTNSWQRARHVPTRRAVFEIKRCQAAAHASPNTRDGHDRQPHAHPFSTPSSSSSSDVLLSVYISTTGLIPLRAGPMNFSLKCVARKWLEIFHLSENVWGNPPLAEAALDPLCRRWILGRNRNAAVHSDYNDESNLLF